MEKKKLVAFLFASLALLIIVMLFESGITGLSVADFSQTSSGASIFSGILLFAFILGIIVFVESRGSLDDMVDATDEKAIAEGRGIPVEKRRAQLSRELTYAFNKSRDEEKPADYESKNNPDYEAAREDRLRLFADRIREMRYEEADSETSTEKEVSESRRKSFYGQVIREARRAKK